MNYMIYLAHPSQFYVFKQIIKILKSDGYNVTIVIKTKDVLEELVQAEGLDYYNVSKRRRKNTFFLILIDVIKRYFNLSRIIISEKINIVLTCGSDISLLAKLFRIPFLLFIDDDFDVVPKSAKFGWPFAPVIFAPKGCNTGKFTYKTIHYDGFQKSFYLQKNVFKPDRKVIGGIIDSNRYFLLRVVGLDAHHDEGMKGIGDKLLEKIVRILKPHGRIIISSERALPEKFEKYLLKIDPIKMHHVIYYADLLIGDSQSMIHEAALMGTPSIRYNSFVGKIGVMNVLENEYGLSIGIPVGQEDELLKTIEYIIEDDNYKSKIKKRLEILNESMVDVNQMVLDYLESKGYYSSNN